MRNNSLRTLFALCSINLDQEYFLDDTLIVENIQLEPTIELYKSQLLLQLTITEHSFLSFYQGGQHTDCC